MSTMNDISFRKLEEKDLKLMHKWLNTEFVKEWYYTESSYESFEEVSKRYLPYIDCKKTTYPFLIVYNGKDIGYIQTYMIKDYPDYGKYVDSDEDAAGMDLFIGEQDYIHKGLGKYILTKFLHDYVFTLNDSSCCIIGPEPKNKAAIKAYEKAGFKYLKTIQVPDEEEPEYLMRLYKKDLKLIDNLQ